MPGPQPGHSYLRLSVPHGVHRKLKAVASSRGLDNRRPRVRVSGDAPRHHRLQRVGTNRIEPRRL